MEATERPASRLRYSIRYLMLIIATIAIVTTALKPPPSPAAAKRAIAITYKPVTTTLPDGTEVLGFEQDVVDATPVTSPTSPQR